MNHTHPLVILHLSDLHFGWNGTDKNELANRNLALNGLLSRLAELDPEWKPDLVCITGDIGWAGKEDDYKATKEWILNLLDTLSLTPDDLFVCPGNHDSYRPLATTNARPGTAEEADQVLVVPVREHFEKPFQEYSQFCRDLGIQPVLLGDSENYLVGARTFKGINFVTYNSAWFSKGNDDKGKLWIGQPHIRFMASAGQLPDPARLFDGPLTIALMHHPREWFHEGEVNAYFQRPNTFDYLARRCHLLFTGHTHGEVRRADRYAEGTWHLSGGAAYAGASHFNSFRLVRVESDRFVYRSFEFDPRSAEHAWRPYEEARTLPFVSRRS